MTDNAIVRLNLPKAVLLSISGTITTQDWEEVCIVPYLRDNLATYLKGNWHSTPMINHLIQELIQESFDQHFVLEQAECPVIQPYNMFSNNENQVISAVNEYVMWQLGRPKTSPYVLQLVRFCWEDGFSNKKIQLKVFDDVLPTIRDYKSRGIKVCIYSALDKGLCKKVLASTTAGDLAQEMDYIFDHDTAGQRRVGSSYDKIATTLNLAKSEILFICDYGQDVKIATENGVKGLIINRPGNRRNRTHYETAFPNATSMTQIEFV